MNEKSLNYLSDFFADAVESKIKSKSQIDLIVDESLAVNYARALDTDKALHNAIDSGYQLDDELVEYVGKHAAKKRLIATTSWNMPELNLMCRYVRLFPKEIETSFVLAFHVTLAKVTLIFTCEANTDGVYNYTLLYDEEEDSDVDDVCEYYFQQTPCAIA
jgi:hypothetical protein